MSELSTSASPDRRSFLTGSGLALGAVTAGLGGIASVSAAEEKPKRFRFCLNMSTIRGQELSAAEEIEVAGKAGYECIEPWFRKLNEYVSAGGSLDDLKKRIDDHGLTVESAIGFAKWIVNDPTERAVGLEEAKRDMDMIARLGGRRIAAPPAGVAGGEVV